MRCEEVRFDKLDIKSVYIRGKEHGENLTVVAYANALRNHIPPLILMKGKRHPEELEDGILNTVKGSMTVTLFF